MDRLLVKGGANRKKAARPVPGSAEKFPQDRISSLRYGIVWVEIRAYLECCLGCFHADHAREQPEVVDVACPGRQRFHRKNVLW
jgi:hypothetical protein